MDVPVPRKRGRPRKAAVLDPISLVDPNNSASGNPLANGFETGKLPIENPIPRKRGRPKKNTAQIPSNINTANEGHAAEKDQVEQEKPNQLPPVETLFIGVQEEAEDLNFPKAHQSTSNASSSAHEEAEAPAQETNSAPKKRGRPKKKPRTEDEADPAIPGPSFASTPRKRGRPKKNAQSSSAATPRKRGRPRKEDQAPDPPKKEVKRQAKPKEKGAKRKTKAELKAAEHMEAMLEEAEINRLLLKAGYKAPKKASKCVRAGLVRGHFGFIFTGDPAQLDFVVLEGNCSEVGYEVDGCKGTLRATIRQLLGQADDGGDYEDGSEGATVVCDTCSQNRCYVTGCCESSEMEWDTGKFHNHCRDCKGLGECLNDYRLVHYDCCDGHYTYFSHGGCPRCSLHHRAP